MNGCFYDLANSLTERYLLLPLRRELPSSLQGEIIDVGAGTGANFRHFGPASRVIALEPDPSMARRAFTKANLAAAHINVRLDDDSALDSFDAQSIDAVIMTLVLCTVESPLATLRRAKRVLRSNGTLVGMEHVRSEEGLGKFQDFIAPVWQRIAGGCHLNRDTKDTIGPADFNTNGLATKTLPKLLPIQKIIYGRATGL